MKKALQISIAKTLFTIEEDAYGALDTYLKSVKQHFESTEGHDEIVSDIETRIAEELLESKEQVVTMPTVEKIIAQMGSVDDFEDSETTKTARTTSYKRLYRDNENKIISGLCAGLAAYFGIEAQWVRIGFVILTLFNGIGLLIYIVLWIILPEAKTASQKLEMSGTPVTLETLKETASERIAELRSSRAPKFGRILAFPFLIVGKLLRIIFGFIFIFAPSAAIVGIMLASGFLMSGTNFIADDAVLTTLLSGGQYWLVIVAAMITLIIPLIFIIIGGATLLFKKKVVITSSAALGLVGIWLVAITVSGFGIARIADNYQEYMSNSPEFDEITRITDIREPFTAIEISHGAHVTIVESTNTATSISATGVAKYIDSYNASVSDGVLTIEPKPREERFCLLCFFERPELTLSATEIKEVNVLHGSSLHSKAFPADESLGITLENGSEANLDLDLDTLTVSLSNGSRANFSGTASTANFSASNGSHVDALNLKINDAKVEARHGSWIELDVLESLEAEAANGSSIRYQGEPEVTHDESGGSRIYSY